MQPQHEKRPPDRREPVTLAPLTPEEALRALLAVDPDDKTSDPMSEEPHPDTQETNET